MAFILSKLLWPLAAPANLIVLLLAIGAALLFTRWRRAGRRLIVALAVALMALAVLPVGDWVTRPLEERFPPPDPLPARVDGIVVLGGAVQSDLVATRGEVGLNEMAERFTALITLARRYPQARLVYTAGDPSLRGSESSPREADAARHLYDALGVDMAGAMFDPEARTTFENAVRAKAAARPQPGETWLLVTSAWHMPRSVGVFRAQGWPVVAYPVDYSTAPGGWRDKGLDLANELARLNRGVREWVGLLAYRLAGYTDALFPAPGPT